MKLEEKKNITENLHERFSKSAIVIVTDYKGLDVATISDLRRKLREVNVEFQVVKNTLLVRAAADTNADLIRDHFKGPSAVALSYDDPVAPAKVLTKFIADHAQLEIKAGVINGKVLDPHAIKALSTLPSREVLLSKLLSVFNAVPASFVRTLSEIPKKWLYVLLALKGQKESA